MLYFLKITKGVNMENSKKAKLLLIDNEEWFREILKDILQNNGYLVQAESDGLSALQKLKKEHFDAIICDIDMPGCSGITVLEKAKLIDPEVKVIMMISGGNKLHYYFSMFMGANGFFSKPFDICHILSIIERSLQ